MQKHNDAMKTSGHSSLEKYTSHFIERVVCERELEAEQNCNILTPTLMAITAFRSPGLLNQPLWDMILIPASSLQRTLISNCSIGGPEGPLYWVLVLSTASYLQLSRTSGAPSYIIVLRPLCSTCRQSRLSPWDLQPDSPVIYIGAFPILTARPGSICNKRFCILFGNSFPTKVDRNGLRLCTRDNKHYSSQMYPLADRSKWRRHNWKWDWCQVDC